MEQVKIDSDLSSKNRDGPKPINESLRLVHHHPGYLRIQVDAFIQGDGALVKDAQAAAEAFSGYRSWTYNPRTGSVVVEYDPDICEPDDLLSHIVKSVGLQGVVNSSKGKMNRQELVSAFLNSVEDVNQIVSHLTGNRADLRELVPAALAITSVVSWVYYDDLGRLPPWYSTLYRSYRVFMQWHRKEIRTREKVSRQKKENGNDQ